MRYARAAKFTSAVASVGLLVGAITIVPAGAGPLPPIPSPITSKRPPGLPRLPVDTHFGSVVGGGDSERLNFGNGTIASVSIGAHRTSAGLVGQVAQVNVPSPGNDNPGPLAKGHYVGDVTCLQVYGKVAYVSVNIRHGTDQFDNTLEVNPVTVVQYKITDNGGNSRDTVSASQFAGNLIRTNNPCNFQANGQYHLVEGRFEVNAG